MILENEGLEGRGLTWEQLGMDVGIEATKLTIKNTMGSLDYHKCLACQRGWQSPRSCANRMEYALKNIPSWKIGIEYARVMKYTLGGGHNASYTSYESQVKDIASTVFSTGKSQEQKMKKSFTVGRLWGTTSNLTLSSMMCPGITMAKCHLRSAEIRS